MYHWINGFFIYISVPSSSYLLACFLALHFSHPLCITAIEYAILYFASLARRAYTRSTWVLRYSVVKYSRRESPGRPGEESDEPGGETAAPGDFQRPQERPRSIRNERVDRTNAPSPDKAPGGHIDDQEASRDVEGDWSRESDGDGVGYNGRRDGKDGATSGARRDSQRVATKPLAGDKGQSQQVERDITMDIPEASTPPPNYPKRPVELPNPPRRRGRMKSRPRKISQADMKKTTYRVVKQRRGQSGSIGGVGYVVYGVQSRGSIPDRYRSSTTLQRARTQDRAHHGQHSAVPEPRLTIYGNS
jgi:hypothetical protein